MEKTEDTMLVMTNISPQKNKTKQEFDINKKV